VRVAVLAIGSRGDVEPFLALSTGLRRRGHTVVVATHAEFAAMVTGVGVDLRGAGRQPARGAEQPATPTAAMPAASLPSVRPPPAALNKATWRLSEALTWRAFRPTLNGQRTRAGLAALPRRPWSRWPRDHRPPVLYGFSPSVVPVPPDWPDDVHVTGYWFRDPDPAWTLPPALAVAFGRRDGARRLAEELAAEDGVAQAVALLEERVGA
jgi:Glycosyltransferase family 28 N-terminal domain